MTIQDRAPKHLRDLSLACEPVRWNLRGMLSGWAEYPGAMDFLDPASSNFAFKALQSRLYREVLGEALDPPAPPPLRILDAACGIGRFTVPLARAGHSVVALDACRPSLEAAERHIEAAAVGDRVQLVWDDIDTCEGLDGPFDRIYAFELLCYLPDAAATARRLASLLRPGGLLVASVEAWPGALLADPSGLSVASIAEALQTRILAVPDDRWVRAFAGPELAAILQSAGLESATVEGTHYVPDGPLMPSLDFERIGEPSYDADLVRLETLLRQERLLAPLSRALLATAKRPERG